jgi:hypothetical protein
LCLLCIYFIEIVWILIFTWVIAPKFDTHLKGAIKWRVLLSLSISTHNNLALVFTNTCYKTKFVLFGVDYCRITYSLPSRCTQHYNEHVEEVMEKQEGMVHRDDELWPICLATLGDVIRLSFPSLGGGMHEQIFSIVH